MSAANVLGAPAPTLERAKPLPRRPTVQVSSWPAAARLLVQLIARDHDVAVDAIVSRSRLPHIVLARHHFIAVLRWSTWLSFPVIGAMLGLDHTTCIAAERRWLRILNGEEDPVDVRQRLWRLT
jgi:chromosomal replication initiation ATPase DnaA